MTEHVPVPAADIPGGDDAGDAAAAATWSAAAAAVLRRAGRFAADAPDSEAWDGLRRTTVEGIAIPPLGTATRASHLPTASALAADPGSAPYLRGNAPSGGWDARALIADEDSARAGAAVQANVAGGAQSLWVRLGAGGTDVADLADVLAGVDPETTAIALDCGRIGDDVALAAARVLADVGSRGGGPHPHSGVGADPVGRRAREALAAEGSASGDASAQSAVRSTEPRLTPTEHEIVAMAADVGIAAMTVDGTAVHDAGAGDAFEIAYALAAGAWYLRSLTAGGIDIDAACRLVTFRFAVTDEQFTSIAKLRAARLVWHRVAQLCGASAAARRQRQHAVTSAAMMTRYDPWVNMLRGTVAAFAAGVGGAEAVTVLPFDSALGTPGEFGHRMARNVSALLLGESHVGAVADPAGGSYAVELLTTDLAQAAWTAFGEIEAVGGVLAAIADGSIAAAVAHTRSERDRRVVRRTQPITGVSEFPDVGESPAALPQRRRSDRDPVRRWAEPFEEMRDVPPRRPVVLVTVGSAAAASARELFIRNVLASGGVAVQHDEAPDAGSVVVVAGSDDGYAAELGRAARAAKDAGARAVFVAGRPRAVLDAVPDGLVDGTVALGDDVVTFLHTVRRALGGVR